MNYQGLHNGLLKGDLAGLYLGSNSGLHKGLFESGTKRYDTVQVTTTGAGATNAVSGAVLTPSYPSTRRGDLLLLVISTRSTIATATPTPSSDWTLVADESNGVNQSQYIYFRFWNSDFDLFGQTTTITFNAGAVCKMAFITGFRGVDLRGGEWNQSARKFPFWFAEKEFPVVSGLGNPYTHGTVQNSLPGSMVVNITSFSDDTAGVNSFNNTEGVGFNNGVFGSWFVHVNFSSTAGLDGRIVLQTFPLPNAGQFIRGGSGLTPAINWISRTFILKPRPLLKAA